MSRITGRVEVIVNGVPLLNKSGAVISGVGVSGEPNMELQSIVGDNGIHGYIEKPVPARCEVDITDRSDIDISTLASIRENGTIVFRTTGGGKVYTMNNATCLRNMSVTAGEGLIKLTFEGPYWVETSSDT